MPRTALQVARICHLIFPMGQNSFCDVQRYIAIAYPFLMMPRRKSVCAHILFDVIL